MIDIAPMPTRPAKTDLAALRELAANPIRAVAIDGVQKANRTGGAVITM